MEVATAIVAVYAALVATGNLVWQVYSWWHRRQPRVAVTAQIGLAVFGGSSVEIVSITAINRSEYPVTVHSVGFDLQDRTGRTLGLIQPNTGSTLPGRIDPNDSGQAWTERAALEQDGLDALEPVTAWVRLSTGELVKSKARPLLRRGPD